MYHRYSDATADFFFATADCTVVQVITKEQIAGIFFCKVISLTRTNATVRGKKNSQPIIQ